MLDSPIDPPTPRPPTRSGIRNAAVALGIVALTAAAIEGDFLRDVQRYCSACWRNARLDPGLWDDCTQEVCCRLLSKARQGELDLGRVLEEESAERRELVRAIDMVRKRVQRARKPQPFDELMTPDPGSTALAQRRELGEVLEAARRAVLSPLQDRILEMWTAGWTVPEISDELAMPVARVSDQKYKALRKLERQLADRRDDLGFGVEA